MKALEEKLRLHWCELMHEAKRIINITPTTYQCGKCGMVKGYDWWKEKGK